MYIIYVWNKYNNQIIFYFILKIKNLKRLCRCLEIKIFIKIIFIIAIFLIKKYNAMNRAVIPHYHSLKKEKINKKKKESNLQKSFALAPFTARLYGFQLHFLLSSPNFFQRKRNREMKLTSLRRLFPISHLEIQKLPLAYAHVTHAFIKGNQIKSFKKPKFKTHKPKIFQLPLLNPKTSNPPKC